MKKKKKILVKVATDDTPQHLRDSGWIKIRKRGWRDRVNRMGDNRVAKIAKNENQTRPSFQNVDAKVGH